MLRSILRLHSAVTSLGTLIEAMALRAGAFDFVGVAAHEIGHALGFISGVDVLDVNTGTGGDPGPFAANTFDRVTPLDMFRQSTASVAANALEWAAGQAAGSQFFSIDGGATNLTTFSTGRNVGDGQQASHWQDNLGIGLMDPTFSSQEIGDITRLDVQAFDVIGWDLSLIGANLEDPVITGTPLDDDFIVTRNPTDSNIVQVQRNGDLIFALQLSELDSLTINGFGGNDTLTVDSTNGLITIPDGIRFHGDDGFDRLDMRQTGGVQTSETVHIGQTPGDGQDIIVGPAGTQLVQFENLEPITTNIAAPDFNITSVPGLSSLLQDDNQINYESSPLFGPTWGRVTVDNFEFIDFINKTNLTIDAGAGSDEISLNNPMTPTGLTGIMVNGGNPTADSDTVIVNGTTGTDTVTIDQIDIDGARIMGAQPVTVTVDAAEGIVYSGQDGDDMITAQSPTGGHTWTITPGATTDDARLQLIESLGVSFLPIDYVNVGAAATLSLTDAGGSRQDSLQFLGTNQDDLFQLGNPGPDEIQVLAASLIGPQRTIRVQTPGIVSANLIGLNGDDTFNLPGDFPYSLTVEGGNPSSDGDVVNVTFVGTQTATLAHQGGNANNQMISGLVANHTVAGTERISFVGSGDDSLIVSPGAGDHHVRVDNGPGPFTDRVLSDALPQVDFNGLLNFTLDEFANIGNIAATFVMSNLAGAVNYQTILNEDDTLFIEGTDGQADSFTAVNPAGASLVSVTDNISGITVTDLGTAFQPLARLQINGLGGDDTLTVDVGSTDVIGVPITFDGGGGSDTLTVSGTPATAIDEVIYTPGANVTAGRLLYEDVANTTQMTIDFVNLEPVVDLVPANTLTVNGTNDANSISYRQTPGDATRGRVTVDSFEFIDFANKVNLTLNGLNGSDEFSLNNPMAPTALTGITVNGGNPTAGSDVAIISATTAADGISFAATTDNDAVVAGAGPVTITLATTERAVIDGQGGNDTVTVNTPATSESLTLTPGAHADMGMVDQIVVGGRRLMPMSFLDIGENGTLAFTDAAGKTDDLVIQGTTGDDRFNVTAAGNVTIRDNQNTPLTPTITTAGIDELLLRGHDGDDTFNVPGNHPFAGTTGLVVEGGNPGSGSDVLNFTGAGATVTMALGASTITETGFAAVNYTGVETANVNAGGANLTMTMTAGDDVTDISLTGASAGRLQNNDVSPIVHFSNSATFTVDQLAGDNVLRVRYTTNADTIAVNVPAGTISDGTLETVNFVNANTDAVQVYGEEGNDTFNVTPDPNIPIFIDGGDSIGTSPGDTLNILAGGMGVVLEPGPENDEGGFIVGVNERVSFDHIEALGVLMAPKAFIAGTGADDEITIIARDATTHAGTDGVQDFTSQVNAGPQILWINTPVIVVDAQAGDDDIVMRVPAPNNVNWNVTAFIFGGAPAAGPFSKGDRFELESPQGAADNILYTPTAVDAGIIVIDEAGTGGFVPATDTMIQLGNVPAMPPMPGLPIPDPGGIETFVYDGGGGNGLVTIFGDAAVAGAATNDIITHTPGSEPDDGTVLVNSLLAIQYTDLGLTGTVAVDGLGGTDTLNVVGTNQNDILGVAGVTGLISHTLSNGQMRVPIRQVNIEGVVLDGLNGADTFNIAGSSPSPTTVNGGNPDNGSDVINFTSTGATILDFGTRTIDDDLVIPPADVSYTGIETVNIMGAGFGLTTVGTGNDDVMDYTPQGAAAGRVQANAVAPVVNFSGVSSFTVSLLGATGDVLVVHGTSNHDVISVDSPTRTVTVTNAAATVLQPVVLHNDVEQVKIEAGLGNDTIVVVPGPPVGPNTPAPQALPTNLLVDVDGGPPGASDALVIAGNTAGGLLPASDFVVHHKSRTPDEGRLRVFRNMAGVIAPLPDISYADVEIVSPLVFVNANPAIGPQLLRQGPDLFEENESFQNAAHIGSGQTINLENLAIFPDVNEHPFVPNDTDFFRIVADDTGTLDIQAFFNTYAGLLPGGGDIDIRVLDVGGSIIAGPGAPAANAVFGVANFGGTNNPNERLRVPVVAGQTYYVQVFNPTTTRFNTNGYNLTITNEAPPTPYDLELGDIVATGGVTGIPAAANAAQTYVTLGAAVAPGALNSAPGFYVGNFINILTGTGNAAIGTRALITGYTGNAAGNLPGGVVGAPAFSFSFATPPNGLTTTPVAGDAYLIESTNDTGRSQFDNVTRNATPTVFFRLDDNIFLNDVPGNPPPPNVAAFDQPIPVPFNTTTTTPPGASAGGILNSVAGLTAGYRVAVFIEGAPQQPGTVPETPIGFAVPVAGSPGVYAFNFATGVPAVLGGLTNGSHFISARADD